MVEDDGIILFWYQRSARTRRLLRANGTQSGSGFDPFKYAFTWPGLARYTSWKWHHRNESGKIHYGSKPGHIFCYLTSYTDSETLEQVKGTTPAAYIAKPFHQAQLKSTIELVLAWSKEKLQNSTLTLEQLNKRLSIGLTDKEWIITQLLAQGKSNEQMGAHLNLHVQLNSILKHIR